VRAERFIRRTRRSDWIAPGNRRLVQPPGPGVPGASWTCSPSCRPA